MAGGGSERARKKNERRRKKESALAGWNAVMFYFGRAKCNEQVWTVEEADCLIVLEWRWREVPFFYRRTIKIKSYGYRDFGRLAGLGSLRNAFGR